jgi:hypothetical protein
VADETYEVLRAPAVAANKFDPPLNPTPLHRRRRVAKMTLNKPHDQEEPARQKGQHRAAEERYRLRVDGQLKRSFSSKEAALTAGPARSHISGDE